jgi:hypothetical protein
MFLDKLRAATGMAQVVRDVPRDTEVTDLLKALAGAGPLPPR